MEGLTLIVRIAYNSFIMKKPRGQSGQILLIILLVMVVGLTIGLSLATRSNTDIKVSNQLEQSSRAFSAAEAGIEAALKGETVPVSPVTLGNNANYIFQRAVDTGNSTILSRNVAIADTFSVLLSRYDTVAGALSQDEVDDYDGSTVDVCWKKPDGSTQAEPAMEISLVYKTQTGDYKILRGAYDSEGRGNNFTAAVAKDCGLGFSHGITFGMAEPTAKNVALLLRLRPFYGQADIGVSGVTSFPGQGDTITSTGSSGGSTRKIVVTETYPVPPAILDYVLFSEQNVVR